MSEVDKLFARKNIYTNHNGVSMFNFYLHIRLLAATFKFYFILINCISRVPSIFLVHVSYQRFYYDRNRPGSDTGSDRPVTGQVPKKSFTPSIWL